MADLKEFRELVTKYRKPYTQAELERAIGLPAGELSHRLNGTGRQLLTRQNVLDIVVTLAEWQGVKWKEAVELLEVMDYPLDTFEWKRRLQEHLTPPDRFLPGKGTQAGAASEIQEKTLPQPRPRLFHHPNRPEGYVPRHDIFQEIKNRVLEKDGGQTVGITTALRGAGGFGKTTLARVLCHDPEIQAAFPDILWIELGERPPRALDLLNRLLTLYEESSPEALTLQEALERWHLALRDRACLLIIDDVWQQEALSPLLQGGARCRHLVTTRNDVLLPRSAVRVVVDAMTLSEAVAVLYQDEEVLAELMQPVYRSQLEALAQRLGCWPLLLTLARGMLAELVEEAHLTLSEALTTLSELYETQGVSAFRLDHVEERQRTVDTCLKVSVEHLETFAHPQAHAKERYQELAVFPEDTDIALTTLQIYWYGSASMAPAETKALCLRLYRLSLLQRCDLGQGSIRLHDVVRSYLIQQAGNELPTLHQRLLDTHQQHYHLTRWADLPQSETYLWQRLIFHLCQAGNQEPFQHPLTDLLYLTRKIVYVGVSALEADLELAMTSWPQGGEEHGLPPLAPLHQMIRHRSYLLHQVASEADVGGLLLSHLPDDVGWDQQRRALEQDLPRPFVTRWHPSPASFSLSALIRTLHPNTSGITACGFSPDGTRIVSAPDDHMLKVWDSRTGAECLTLKGHTSWVYACGFSPDGTRIVSASMDETLKVWDATSGAERLTLKGHTGVVFACAFSPNGKWIVSASSDRTLKVWDGRTGAERLTLRGHTKPVLGCAASPDGCFIVSASSDQTLKVWDAATGTERLALSGHNGRVWGCAVSPDGCWIVSASSDQTLKVWDAATGTERLTLSGHTDEVHGCAVSPDGQWVISTSLDHTLKMWDAHIGRCLLTFPVEGALLDCAFHPDGEHLVACGDRGMYFLRLVQ